MVARNSLYNVKAFAVDIDGPLVLDTFSPVLRRIFTRFMGEYTSNVEKNTLSCSRSEAAQYVINNLGLNLSQQEIIELYFKERKIYIEENPDKSGLVDGIEAFLNLLAGYDLTIVCYGGLEEEYFHAALKEYTRYFDFYVCTDEFRPGIEEIIKRNLKLDYNEVIFFDDVNNVAVEAKKLRVPFIGIPSTEFQRQEMKSSGVKYIVESISSVNTSLLSEAAQEY